MINREIVYRVRPPRAIFLKWPFGHPLGEPDNLPQQRRVLQDALDLAASATEPTIVELGYRWRRERYVDPWEGDAAGANATPS
ncbi:MAG: hypothetical protein M5R36_01850 [Deltaproteobacteria bacterium]|nr:hypothetical protein [Deltaproteobacteria bacterium]